MSERSRLRDVIGMQTAIEWANLGTCNRLKVGCCIVRKNHRVAGIGYNGADHGMDHCDDEHCGPNHRCYYTRHAERNALDTFEGEAEVCYVTHEPCIGCLKDLIARGIKRIVFNKPYTSSSEEEKTAITRWIKQKVVVMHQIYSPEWEKYHL